MRVAAHFFAVNDLIVVIITVAVISLYERADPWRNLQSDPRTRTVLPTVALAVIGVTDILVIQPLHTAADNCEEAREIMPILAVDIATVVAGEVAASAAAANGGQSVLLGVTAVLVQAIEAENTRHDIVAGHVQPAAG